MTNDLYETHLNLLKESIYLNKLQREESTRIMRDHIHIQPSSNFSYTTLEDTREVSPSDCCLVMYDVMISDANYSSST